MTCASYRIEGTGKGAIYTLGSLDKQLWQMCESLSCSTVCKERCQSPNQGGIPWNDCPSIFRLIYDRREVRSRRIRKGKDAKKAEKIPKQEKCEG